MSDTSAQHGHDDPSGGHAAHPPHLAHHFDTPEQQMESGKLGMWVFLATEILMFGGLFCAYSIYRANHPDVFLFAHQYLDTTWGAINTVVLLASSFTMAWGVRAAQLGQKNLLVGLLIATLLGGGGFMLIKTVEYKSKYSHDIWVGGLNGFYQRDGELLNVDGKKEALKYLDKKHAKKYGTAGHGDGHGEEDSHGNDHADPGHGSDDHPSPGHAETQPTDGDAHADGADHAAPAKPVAVVEVSNVAPPALAATGLIPSLADHDTAIPAGPESFTTGVGALQVTHHGSHYPEFNELATIDANSLHIFFQIYFMMTGLHGIHVLVGMGLISWICYRAGGATTRALLLPGWCIGLALYGGFVWWLLDGGHAWILVLAGISLVAGLIWGALQLLKIKQQKKAAEGEFGPGYYTPVDLVGLYWHLVDLIWIFLFPLLYLIH